MLCGEQSYCTRVFALCNLYSGQKNAAKPVSVNFVYTSLGIQSEYWYKVKDKDLEQEDLIVKLIDFGRSINSLKRND